MHTFDRKVVHIFEVVVYIYYTQKMFELLTNTDISKFYNMSWTELFTKFDLEKSNMTWNDFTSIFNMADGLDVQK
jgi:hypothetical protein